MDYIKGNYYKGIGSGDKKDMLYIWICGKDNEKYYSYRVVDKPNKPEEFETNYAKNCSHGWNKSIEPTIEEINWLDLCIKYNKYISYEESLTMISKNLEIDSNLEQIWIKLLP
jgi:hypothetical protein